VAQHDKHGETSKSGSGGHGVSPINLQKHLKGTTYPASKQDLVTRARSNHAPDDMLERIGQLPEHTYESPADVMRAFGRSQ
jgi:hypothetical protein